jgi:hypothetical protein
VAYRFGQGSGYSRRREIPVRVHWNRTPARLWASLGDGEDGTRCVWTIRAREFDRRRRLLPGTASRSGRKGSGRRWPSAEHGCVDLLRVKSKEQCQRGRRREGEAIGERRRRGDASLHGNRRELAVALRSSGEKFCRPGGDFRGKWKGLRWRRSRAFYRHS